MEWSVHITGADDIGAQLEPRKLALRESGSKLRPVLALTAALIEEYFGRLAFSRCVYGNEFCEHLIPSREKLAETLAAADNAGLPVTFLTPYCSDAGIEALKLGTVTTLDVSQNPVYIGVNNP